MSKRIKILYTIPNFDTAGSGKVVYDLVKHIDKEKFEPHICCEHTKGIFFNKVKALGVPVHITHVAVGYKPLITLLYRVFKVSRFLRRHKFDVVHSWHWSSDFTEPLAAKLAGIPFVYTKKAMGWGNKAWKWRSQLSTKIVTINSDMETQFFSDMKAKIQPIPIGLNVNDFELLDKAYTNEDGYNIDEEDFVIVSVANLVEVKGIEFLLEAVKQISNPKVKVFIVGDDTSKYALKLKEKYQSSTILFTGKKQNVKSYLALSDVFVIPTKDEGRKEGQPIAPIEAMLSGRLVIGSKVSGIIDVLKEFPNYLFEAEQVDALKEKLEYLIHLPKHERITTGKQMREFIINNYDIAKSIETHERLYKSIIGK